MYLINELTYCCNFESCINHNRCVVSDRRGAFIPKIKFTTDDKTMKVLVWCEHYEPSGRGKQPVHRSLLAEIDAKMTYEALMDREVLNNEPVEADEVDVTEIDDA